MFPSVLRTVVAVVAGILLAQAARIGLDLPAGAVTEITTVVLTTLYYGIVRAAEQRWPAVGRWLLALGLPVGQPTLYR